MTLSELAKKAEDALKGFSPPPVHHTANLGHLYADYVELLCCLRNGELISKSGLIKRFEEFDETVPALSSTVAGPATPEELSAAEEDDAFDSWAIQVFANLETRIDLFADSYPFEFEKGALRLKEKLDQRQEVYIALLMCGNLPYFKDFGSILTTDFEAIAFNALKSYLPKNAVVRQLGKNTDYPGNAQAKIKSLASELNVDIDSHEVQKVQGNQERGLDIVGWIPFTDRYANLLCVMGQCACGMDWPAKLSETRRFEYSYFRFKKFDPIHAMFVPRGFFHNDDFFQSDEISRSLIFDRGRLLQFLDDVGFFKDLKSQVLVKAYLECVEEVA